MKKIVMIVGGLVLTVLGAMVVIPLVVDVNQYRPQILKVANENLNGTLEIGSLKLKLWGKIEIGIDGLSLMDAQKRSVIKVKDASFEMPYLSFFSGSPLITLKMVKPEINMLKSKEGKLNVMSLMKSGVGTQSTASSETAQKIALPAVALNARVGVSIEDAKLVYQDEALSLKNVIDRLNLRVKDFSLTRKTEMELWADLKTTMGTDLKLEGPLRLEVALTPEISGGEFKSASMVSDLNASDLQIQKGDLFFKKKGVPTRFQFDGSLDQEKLTLKKATISFHNAEVIVSGSYHQKQGASIHLEAKPVDLKPWSELIPMLKDFELEGKLSFKGDIKGTADALQYQMDLGVSQLSMKGPYLKAKPVINAQVMIATDRIEKFVVDLSGPGSQLVLNGKLLSFSKPQLSFSLNSPKGLDLDQWIEFPKTASVSQNVSSEKSGSSSSHSDKADYDAMMDPLRKSEPAKAMVVDGQISIPFIKAMNVKLEGLAAKIQMKNLVAALSGFKMNIYDGSVAGGFTVDLKPSKPQYTMNLNVIGFDMQKAVESQFKSFKDTLIGKLSVSLQGAGSSFNADEIKKRLQMKGEFKIANATFKTIDVARIANSAIGDSLSKISAKVPALQGKKVNLPANKESRYDLVSSQFTLSNGFLDAPNFYAKSSPKMGVDIKGATRMGLVDESLDAKWELIDVHHVTGSDQVNVTIGSKTINNVLAKSEKDPVIFPVSVGCKWSAPCPSYTSTAEYLAGIAAGRLTKAAGEEVKAKVQNAVQDAVKKAIGGGGNPLKGLFGR